MIGVEHDRMGEAPKAFVIKSSSVGLEVNDAVLAREISKYVEQHKAYYKWLRGGVKFVDVIPKSPSGKILRRQIRDQEKKKQERLVAKL